MSPASCSWRNRSYGNVGVECVDHVVAVAVGLADRVVGVIPGRVGIPGEVEPVAPPALAVAGRGEQLVDQPREGVGPLVGHERLDPIGLGRQADQVEVRPADQGAAVGPLTGCSPFARCPAAMQLVDGLRGPSDRVLRRRDRPERLERPVGLALDRPGHGVLRPGRAGGDPRGQVVPGALAGSGLAGGILSASSVWPTAWISRLPCGSPGTTAGPFSPPASIPSRESSRSPPLAFFAPWHFTHVPASTGRTLSSKKLSDAASGASRAGRCPGDRHDRRQSQAEDHPAHAPYLRSHRAMMPAVEQSSNNNTIGATLWVGST